MRHWSGRNLMDPNELPYDSGAGGYQWIWAFHLIQRTRRERIFWEGLRMS